MLIYPDLNKWETKNVKEIKNDLSSIYSSISFSGDSSSINNNKINSEKSKEGFAHKNDIIKFNDPLLFENNEIDKDYYENFYD